MDEPAASITAATASAERGPGARRTARTPLPGAVQIQVASPLVPLEAFAELPDSRVRRDGGSRPTINLLAGDHGEYFCKGPSLLENHPYIGVNELVSGRAARLAGVPVRPVELIRWKGELFVGSLVLDDHRKMTGQLTDEVWARLVNAPDVAYSVVTFDIWVMNEDRHDGNWLGAVMGENTGAFLACDHDLTLLSQGRSPESLGALVMTPAENGFLRSSVLREAITDSAILAASVASITRIDNMALAAVVGQIPDEWLTHDGKIALYEFMRDRRDALPEIIARAPSSLFPKLK